MTALFMVTFVVAVCVAEAVKVNNDISRLIKVSCFLKTALRVATRQGGFLVICKK